MTKARCFLFIPDNVPGHLFQYEEGDAEDTAVCGMCGLALCSFLGHPYPEYDQLKHDSYLRGRAAWARLHNSGSFSWVESAFVDHYTDASKWVVHNYNASRPAHFFNTETQARKFWQSHYRSWFENATRDCNHQISQRGDDRVGSLLIVTGVERKMDGWEEPVPVVSVDTASRGDFSIESFCEYFASFGQKRDLREITHVAYLGVQIGDLLNGKLESTRCYLDETWSVDEIFIDAAGLGSYLVEDIKSPNPYDALNAAACDLDKCLRQRAPLLTPVNLANFWTSLQVFRYFEGFAREKLVGRIAKYETDKARVFLHRRIASYANRLGLAVGVLEPSSASRKTHLADWIELTISFFNEHSVQISISGKREIREYSELGMADRRTGNPNRAWALLRLLAENEGVIKTAPSKETAPSTIRKWTGVEKGIQEIRSWLRRRFDVESDPLPFVKGVGYRSRFHICRARSYHR